MRIMYRAVIIAVCSMPIRAYSVDKLGVPELLDRLTASQDKLKSLVAKTEETIVSSEPGKPTPIITRWVSDIRINGKRTHHRGYRWRHLPAEDAPTPIEDAHCFIELWDGKRYTEYYKPLKAPDKRIAYVSREERHIRGLVHAGCFDTPCLGIRYSDYERIDSVLRQGDSISVRDELEQVGTVACYVIDAKAKSGTYTVWLDPEHGYNVARADIRLGPNDFVFGRRLKDNESKSLSIRNVSFENTNGVWVPMKADLYSATKKQIQDDIINIQSTIHHRVTEITLDPDHDALASFIPEIEDGTTVRDLDSGIRYTWQDGQLAPQVDEFVIEEIDKTVDDILAGKVPPALATTKKTEIAPNEPAADADTQDDTVEAQSEVLSESRPFPVLVFVPIGLLIIAVIVWRVFLFKGS